MTEEVQNAKVVDTKRDIKIYSANPSIPAVGGMHTRTRRVEIPGGSGAVIVDNSTGEVNGLGGIGFWWEQEVDRAKFLKLFEEGVKDAGKLSSTAAQVFHIVQQQVMGNPGKDEVKLNKYVAADYGLSDRTYRRGAASYCRNKSYIEARAMVCSS
jgi:hypothetical protein